MKTCSPQCKKLPCCDFCSYAIQGTMEVDGKTITTGPEGCKLHIDEEHQEIAKSCGYCDDFKCFNLKEEEMARTTNGKSLMRSNFTDTDGETKTEALYVETNGLYTVSELIELLQAAKEKWGDLRVMGHDCCSNNTSGVDSVFLHLGEQAKDGADCCAEDAICVLM